MKTIILLLVLAAASIATPRNQPTVPPTPARNSTSPSRNNTMSTSGCKSSTLRWGQIRPTLFSSLHSKITFEVEVDGRYYYGKLPFHKDTDYQKQWCSDDTGFCVTHASGATDKSLTIMFNGLLYHHSGPDKIYTHDPDAFNYEYWDCVS
ncbi:MAG: hypothetical protein JOS17DRAFT_727521 [Linnemannia elongata]|nr:MAG: hypothetical protein JOS17DRAFT_727521 [Linnemannia elongata]